MTRIEVPDSGGARRASGRLGRWLAYTVLLLLAGSALWSWLTLAWAYSDGERAGVLQKFSRKGWVCKTYEGEIAQYLVAGISPQMWSFSVRDPAVALQLDKAVGHRVQLHYTEHPGVPTSCFAETRYFVDRVTVTDDPWSGPSPGSGQGSAAAPTPGKDALPGATLPPPPPPP
jgi:hypothetical protein